MRCQPKFRSIHPNASKSSLKYTPARGRAANPDSGQSLQMLSNYSSQAHLKLGGLATQTQDNDYKWFRTTIFMEIKFGAITLNVFKPLFASLLARGSMTLNGPN